MSTQEAISRSVQPGARIPTPSGRSAFEVAQITADAVVLLFGPKRTPTRIPWKLLDEVVAAVPSDRWIPVGAMHSSSSEGGTLEALLKPSLKRSTASYVAALLEKAGLLELDRSGAHRIRRR
ncbi:MAG: hypothetical protein O2822_00105 [Chloroflexi bacterium]|nr:hypothetical protein [Chloroflexota bacterium]